MLLFNTLHYTASGKRQSCCDVAITEEQVEETSRTYPHDYIEARCVNGDPRDVRWYHAGKRVNASTLPWGNEG